MYARSLLFIALSACCFTLACSDATPPSGDLNPDEDASIQPDVASDAGLSDATSDTPAPNPQDASADALEGTPPPEDTGADVDDAPDSGDSGETDPDWWADAAACGAAPLGPDWTSSDIGDPALAGVAGARGDAVCVHASGADIWNTRDAFRFVWREVTGDVQLTARVATFVGEHPYAKAGVMIRASLDAASSHAMVNTTPQEGDFMTYRDASGAQSASFRRDAGGAPAWVRLTRRGDRLIGEVRGEDDAWVVLGERVLEGLEARAYVGLAVTSHDDAQTAQARFDAVTVERLDPVEPPDCMPPEGTRYDSWTELAANIQDGESAVLRGGRTEVNDRIRIHRDNITVQVECGEVHTLDASGYQPSNVWSGAALRLSGANITVDGTRGRLVVERSGSIGFAMQDATDFVVRGVTARYNRLIGVFIDGGSHRGLIEDCDAYANFGPLPGQAGSEVGGDADGFQVVTGREAPRSDWPSDITFRRCSAHHNSDDGFDFIRSDRVVVERSVAYANGYDATGVGDASDAPGVGYKVSYSQADYYDQRSGHDAPNGQTLRECIAWGNGDPAVLVGSGDAHVVDRLIAFANSRKRSGKDLEFWDATDVLIRDSTYTDTYTSSGATFQDNRVVSAADFGTDTALTDDFSPANPATFLRELAPWAEGVITQSAIVPE